MRAVSHATVFRFLLVDLLSQARSDARLHREPCKRANANSKFCREANTLHTFVVRPGLNYGQENPVNYRVRDGKWNPNFGKLKKSQGFSEFLFCILDYYHVACGP